MMLVCGTDAAEYIDDADLPTHSTGIFLQHAGKAYHPFQN